MSKMRIKKQMQLLAHLICHDHDLAITQGLEGFWVTVVLLVLKAKDLDDVVDFSILHDLMKTAQFSLLAVCWTALQTDDAHGFL